MACHCYGYCNQFCYWWIYLSLLNLIGWCNCLITSVRLRPTLRLQQYEVVKIKAAHPPIILEETVMVWYTNYKYSLAWQILLLMMVNYDAHAWRILRQGDHKNVFKSCWLSPIVWAAAKEVWKCWLTVFLFIRESIRFITRPVFKFQLDRYTFFERTIWNVPMISRTCLLLRVKRPVLPFQLFGIDMYLHLCSSSRL